MTPPPEPQEQKLLRKLFDPSFYLDRNPDVKESGEDPFVHFIEHGAFEGRSPHPLFDAPFYLAHHPEVAQAGLNPVLHFLRTGARAGANPHPLFDTIYYCGEYPDVTGAGLNPLIHFIEHGAVEGRNPHPFFNMAAYLAANPDVDESGVNPLIHYISTGADEGRSIRRAARPTAGAGGASKGPPVTSGHLITNLRMESLRRKLAIALMQVEHLQQELKSPHANPGKLVTCPDPFYKGRIYYCLNGKRHWVVPNHPSVPGDPSQGHLVCYGLSLTDLVTIEPQELRQYTLAGPLPLLWPAEFWEDPVRSCPFDLREISTSQLRGEGIEFGAGTEPMSVPLCCEVK